MIGFLRRLFETRASVKASDPFIAEMFGVRGTGIGSVTPDSVLSNLSVAYRCVALRSELLASVALILYRRTGDGGRERAEDHPLHGVLRFMFNDNATAFEAREWMIRSHDLTGNGYAVIERNARGEVVALYPQDPRNVAVERLPSGRLRYRIGDPFGGPTITHLQEELLHLRGPSRDGMIGLSPIHYATGSLALAIEQSEMARNFLGNGLRPSGIMSYPEKLGKEARTDARASLETNFAGTGNAGKILITDGGAKFDRISLSPEDAQAIENRKVSNEDVARLFGVPPTAVGITDKSTYNNVEQEARALVQNALAPLAARFEAAIARCCLTTASRRIYYAEHDLDGLQRGDVKSRFEAYRVAREIGVFSANDVRRRENEPPIPAGDEYNQPVNWTKLGATAPAARSADATVRIDTGASRGRRVTVTRWTDDGAIAEFEEREIEGRD